VSRAQREFDRRVAQLDTELAVRRLEAEIELMEIRARQNRELWYLAGVLAGVAVRVWIRRCES
jgi:hypothetical protein